MKLIYIRILLIEALFISFADLSLAQRSLDTQEHSILNDLAGTWTGKGTLMGLETEFEMQWEKILNDQFVRLIFENRRKGKEGNIIVFKAIAFYKPVGDQAYTGTWFDSRGITFPLESSEENNALTTLWGSPETEQGKTIYILTNPDRVEVEDFVLVDDQMRSFGKAVYTKTDR